MANLRNISVWLDTILSAVKDRLVDEGLFPAEYVFLSLVEEQGLPPGTDRYAVLVPGAQRPDAGAVAGGGNRTFLLNGELDVILWARLSLDPVHRADSYLTHATLGALGTLRAIVKALQLFDPQDGNGDYLLTEPMRLASTGWRTHPRRPQSGWGSISATWSFQYLADVG